jgi:serine/threonine protein kinase
MPSGTGGEQILGVGQVLDGWLLRELIGWGGMGVVYLAEHTGSGLVAALKMLHSPSGSGPEVLKRFRREVQALARFEHPAVVRILQEALDSDPPYFCMELLPGGSLASLIHRALVGEVPSERGEDGEPRVHGQGVTADQADAGTAELRCRLEARRSPSRPLVEPEWLGNLCLELASGLTTIHQAGVLHRDLKPANILFTVEGQAKLTDFGLAKLLDRTNFTAPNQRMGSLPYMAPESLRGERSSERSDLYQLGATLFETATGRTPYDNRRLLNVSCGKPLGPLPDLDELAPAITRRLPWFRTALEQLLVENPAARFQSAAELVDWLGARVGQEGETPAAPTGAVHQREPDSEVPREEPTLRSPHHASARPGRSRKRRQPKGQPFRWPRHTRLIVGSIVLWAACVAGLANWARLPSPESERSQLSVGKPAQAGPAGAPVPPLRLVTVGSSSVHLWLGAAAPAGLRIEVWPENSSSHVSRVVTEAATEVAFPGLTPDTAYLARLSAGAGGVTTSFRTLTRAKTPGGMLLTDGQGRLDELRVAANGSLLAAVWTRLDAKPGKLRLEASVSPDGGQTFSRPEVLASSRGSLHSVEVSVGGSEVLAVWRQGSRGQLDGEVQARCWSTKRAGWSPPARASVGRNLAGLGLRSREGASELYAVIELPGSPPRRALARLVLSADRSSLSSPTVVAGLPLSVFGSVRVAPRGTGSFALLTGRKDDSTRNVLWTSTRPGEPDAWLPVQQLWEPSDILPDCDLASLGEDLVLAQGTETRIFTGLVSGTKGAPSLPYPASSKGMLLRSASLAAFRGGVCLAYLTLLSPVETAGSLQLRRSRDGLRWENLAELGLRDDTLLGVRLAASEGRLVALLAGEVGCLMVCSFPAPD